MNSEPLGVGFGLHAFPDVECVDTVQGFWDLDPFVHHG